MFFRNYATDLRFYRTFGPALLRASLWLLLRMGWPTRRALTRIMFWRWLRWLPLAIRQWRLGTRLPVTLQIIDDIGCKAGCDNCLFTAFTPREQRLSLQELDRVLDQAWQMGITNIYLLGADPFYRDDLADFLAVLERHPRQLFLLFTEGKRVTLPALERIRRAGHIVPVFNVDGLKEATDRRKGQGSWATLEALLQQLRRQRVIFGVSTMVSTQNLAEVSSSEFALALEARGAAFLAYVPYTPVDLAQERALVLDGDRRATLYERSLALTRQASSMVVFDLLGIEQQLTSCPAALYTMTVFHDGTVTPCLAIPAGRRESNVRQRHLQDIFLNDPLYKALRQRHVRQQEQNRVTGRRDKLHCLFYTDRAFLREYFAEHEDEIRVLAPFAVEWLQDGPEAGA